MTEVTCNKCGWVHMAITESEGGLDCLKCHNCGNSYTDFRPAVEADAPAGVTLQPILDPSE